MAEAKSSKILVGSGTQLDAKKRYDSYAIKMQSEGNEAEPYDEWRKKYYDTAISASKVMEPKK